MNKKLAYLFVPTFCLMMGAVTTSALAAYLTLEPSFFFGQRGAGVQVQGQEGGTDYGHPEPVPGSPLAVDLHGAGSASQTVTVGPTTYEVGEQLSHDIEVEFMTSDTEVDIHLSAHLGFTGELPDMYTVEVTNNEWEHRSYADATAKTVLGIQGNPGEAVRVHIDSWAASGRNGEFETEVGLSAGFPNNFGIYHNENQVWGAGGVLFDPNGHLLDDIVINAMVGDTITVDAAVFANLGGAHTDFDFVGNYAHIDLNTSVRLEAVPIPGAVWLLGSGLIGLLGIRRKSPGTRAGDTDNHRI